MKSISLNNRVA